MNEKFWKEVEDYNIYISESRLLNQDQRSISVTSGRVTDNNAIGFYVGKASNKKSYKTISHLMRLNKSNSIEFHALPGFDSTNNKLSGLAISGTDNIYPSLMESDPGCGIAVARITGFNNFENLDNISDIIKKEIPKDIRDDVKTKRELQILLHQLRCKIDKTNLLESFCTLGEKNHFIEFSKSENGSIILSIHSGSRLLGERVLEYYVKKSEENNRLNNILKDTFSNIEGDKKESIFNCIDNFDIEPVSIPILPKNMSMDFYNDMDIVNEFARRNREAIGRLIIKKLKLEHNGFSHNVHKRFYRDGSMSNNCFYGLDGTEVIMFNELHTYIGSTTSRVIRYNNRLNCFIPSFYETRKASINDIIQMFIENPIEYKPFLTVKYL